MRRDALTRLPGKYPGTSVLLGVVVWLSASTALLNAQQSPPSMPVPAPLPKNLTPGELPDPVTVAEPAVPVPSLLDASCEPTFRSGWAEDCGYCLELWQGYCQEQRNCRHVTSPRHGLHFFFGLCWPRWCWFGHGIPFGLPRFSEPACADAGCAACCATHGNVTPALRQESAAQVQISVPDPDKCPAAVPDSPAAPQPPPDFIMTSGNTQQHSTASAPAVRSGEGGSEPPLPQSAQVPVRRVLRQRSEGTTRLIRLLQQAAEQ